MTDNDKLLLAKMQDRLRLCSENFMITSSDFLDMHERSVISSMKNNFPDVKIIFYGAFEGAERTVAVFLPSYIEAENEAELREHFKACPDDELLRIIEVEKDKFSRQLTHRDYLGALMSLGIKREMTGDIAVSENGCKIAVLEKSARFIAENLDRAGRGTLKTKISMPGDVCNSTKNEGRPESFTVSSMRLDSVCKNAFRVSRTDAVKAIEAGLVYVNDIECDKADKKISSGDKIVFRRKGRIIVETCSAVTKKGRMICEVKKFE